jgi:hypothetical protein
MLFYSFFKTLVGKTVRSVRAEAFPPHTPAPPSRRAATQVTVELKNDLAITGTLHSVDQVR